MHFTTLITASLLGLTTALPSPMRRTTTTTSSSTGFNLRISLLDPNKDLTPSVQGLYLSDLRTGAGTAISTLTTQPTVFYLNGTTPSTTTITHDIPNVYPLSILISGPDSFDYFYPTEHPISTAINGGSLLSLSLQSSPPTPTLLPLAGDSGGAYAVCQRDVVLGGSKSSILTARYSYGNETVPADCAPVEFVVECATLEDLPAGSSWNHDSAVEVACAA
ncbi:hypothetical protein GGR51DRAFT_165750 [Nemania sp. FL0031]|nr:hypothetical protein GGR51DRAFT_165750 [Nemania sp. FL0031]